MGAQAGAVDDEIGSELPPQLLLLGAEATGDTPE
jgi:hypothetical protein